MLPSDGGLDPRKTDGHSSRKTDQHLLRIGERPRHRKSVAASLLIDRNNVSLQMRDCLSDVGGLSARRNEIGDLNLNNLIILV